MQHRMPVTGELVVDTILAHTLLLADFADAFRLVETGKAGKVLFAFS